MKVYDVYVTVTQYLNSNPSGTKQSISKEIFAVGNTAYEAAQNAAYQMRGYIDLNPLIYNVPIGDYINTPISVSRAIDINCNCNFPVKHSVNYTF